MTQEQEARDHAINQEVLAEMEQDRATQQAERARVGDAVAADGTVLHTRQPLTGHILHNNGDNSRSARNRYAAQLENVVANNGTPCCIRGCKMSGSSPIIIAIEHPAMLLSITCAPRKIASQMKIMN